MVEQKLRLSEIKERCDRGCDESASCEFYLSAPSYALHVRNWCPVGHFNLVGPVDERDVLAIAGLMCLKAHQAIEATGRRHEG
ncbi:hypothetical protein GCM10011487_46110 [Steroidobacter agaridevorans]|uniref:Uncharacterized protein n=1 Tax=Steroidobacter agaridevorans TaxID=2695856 RepID=A0A829YIF3_9GAMM|nr:hypothetical protein GCM10011487_46110 [Steroidobacter agaridevorans]